MNVRGDLRTPFFPCFGFVETGMNRVFALKTMKIKIGTTVPRLRASQRHGGARQFLEFF
jgi:hypothetical protein